MTSAPSGKQRDIRSVVTVIGPLADGDQLFRLRLVSS